jgi:hypothetical protein
VLADEASERVFIADTGHHRIVITRLDGTLIDVVGTSKIGAADGDFATAEFNQPHGMALDKEMLYVADTRNHLIRKIDLEKKQVVTVAGTGKKESMAWPGRHRLSPVVINCRRSSSIVINCHQLSSIKNMNCGRNRGHRCDTRTTNHRNRFGAHPKRRRMIAPDRSKTSVELPHDSNEMTRPGEPQGGSARTVEVKARASASR